MQWGGGGGGVKPAMDQHPIQGEVEILASCFRNWGKFGPTQTLPLLVNYCNKDIDVLLSLIVADTTKS